MNHILYYKKDKTLKYTVDTEVFDKLYYSEAIVPKKKHIQEYLKNGKNNEIKQEIRKIGLELIIDHIKNNISKIDYKVPLYDEYIKNLHLIPRELVYQRVVYQYNRFPTEELINQLKERKDQLESSKEILPNYDSEKNLSEFEQSPSDYKKIHQNISLNREYHKLELMLNFLNEFNRSILESTYIKVFYYYANEVGKNITVCIRPSFLPHFTHIIPYYTRSELINLALNIEKIKSPEEYENSTRLMELCDIVKRNDISSDIILKHQEYIIKENKIGLVQYYSLQGSYFMNQYLRNLSQYPYQNQLLEECIFSLQKLIDKAPAFDKSYILYRFINDDRYLSHLKIGEIFVDPAFISTTRDPFYRSEIYKFGFILIKIKIPGDIEGVGLCIETYSNFPNEEEIVLPPLSILRLDKKDENALYYHTNESYAANITTRYEFTFMGKKNMSIIERPLIPNIEKKIVDFMLLPTQETLTVQEKIKKFTKENVNSIYQFKTMIGNHYYDLIVERYDSTTAYKDFYAIGTNNGFSIYSILNSHISFFIEIGENNNETYMYVNFYFKFSTINIENKINDIDFIDFISKVGYYFRIQHIELYAEYSSCDILERQRKNKEEEESSSIYPGGNYCIDFYEYIKYNKRRFQNKEIKIDSTEVKPIFSYYELDRLKTIDPLKILLKEDRDELYQIYTKTYKYLFKEERYNLKDFFIWIIETYCININLLIDKLGKIYNVNNPFKMDYYDVDGFAYLYNRGIISAYPFQTDIDKKFYSTGQEVPKNEYRLQYYTRERVETKN